MQRHRNPNALCSGPRAAAAARRGDGVRLRRGCRMRQMPSGPIRRAIVQRPLEGAGAVQTSPAGTLGVRRRRAGDHVCQPAEYRKLCRTRRTWYRSINAIGRTPGHKTQGGIGTGFSIRKRASCGASVVIRRVRWRSPQTVITPHELGVRCEGCHGPAGAHAKDPAKVRPRNPGKLTADQLNDFCGQCHRMPGIQGDTTDLKDPWNSRHQPVMLAASYCFKAPGAA